MANVAGGNPAQATAMLLLWSTFLIILSGAHSLQCHWCGPLAEQVHHSRRAPPCDEPGAHLTTCDPGFPYCAVVATSPRSQGTLCRWCRLLSVAIYSCDPGYPCSGVVATSPPYVESRYCVKIYQDECYPVFCNSTKTWRMTCPCRGNLCNGANAEREIESFAVLSKLVAKTHNSRIKKRSTETENSSTDVSQDEENTTVVEIMNTSNVDVENVDDSQIKNYGNSNNIDVPDVDLNKDSNLSQGEENTTVGDIMNTSNVDAENVGKSSIKNYGSSTNSDVLVIVPDIVDLNKDSNLSKDDTTTVGIMNTNNVDVENVDDSPIKNDRISNNSNVLVFVPDVDSNHLNEDIGDGNIHPTMKITADDGISAENEENLNFMQAYEPMKVALDIKSENIVTNTENLPGKQNDKATKAHVEIQTTYSLPTTAEVMPGVKFTKANNEEESKRRENESKEKMPTAEALLDNNNDNQADKSTTTEPEVKHVDVQTATATQTTEAYTTPTMLITTTNSTLMSKMNRPTDASPKTGKNGAHLVTTHIIIHITLVYLLWVKL